MDTRGMQRSAPTQRSAGSPSTQKQPSAGKARRNERQRWTYVPREEPEAKNPIIDGKRSRKLAPTPVLTTLVTAACSTEREKKSGSLDLSSSSSSRKKTNTSSDRSSTSKKLSTGVKMAEKAKSLKSGVDATLSPNGPADLSAEDDPPQPPSDMPKEPLVEPPLDPPTEPHGRTSDTMPSLSQPGSPPASGPGWGTIDVKRKDIHDSETAGSSPLSDESYLGTPSCTGQASSSLSSKAHSAGSLSQAPSCSPSPSSRQISLPSLARQPPIVDVKREVSTSLQSAPDRGEPPSEVTLSPPLLLQLDQASAAANSPTMSGLAEPVAPSEITQEQLQRNDASDTTEVVEHSPLLQGTDPPSLRNPSPGNDGSARTQSSHGSANVQSKDSAPAPISAGYRESSPVALFSRGHLESGEDSDQGEDEDADADAIGESDDELPPPQMSENSLAAESQAQIAQSLLSTPTVIDSGSTAPTAPGHANAANVQTFAKPTTGATVVAVVLSAPSSGTRRSVGSSPGERLEGVAENEIAATQVIASGDGSDGASASAQSSGRGAAEQTENLSSLSQEAVDVQHVDSLLRRRDTSLTTSHGTNGAVARSAKQIRSINGNFYVLQRGSCRANKTLELWGNCRACIWGKKVGADERVEPMSAVCDFASFRWVPCDLDGRIEPPEKNRDRNECRQRLHFGSQPSEDTLAMLPLSGDFNRDINAADVSLIESVSAKHLLSVLEDTLEHSRRQGCVTRARDYNVRLTCSWCATSIFSAAYKCRICGGDYCLHCTDEISRVHQRTVERGRSYPPSASVKSQGGLTQFDCRATNLFHEPVDLIPVVMHTSQELEKNIAAMQLVLKQFNDLDSSRPIAYDLMAPSNSKSISSSSQLTSATAPHITAAASPDKDPFLIRQAELLSDVDKHVGSRDILEAPSGVDLNICISKVWKLGRPIVSLDATPPRESNWPPSRLSRLYGDVNCTIKLGDRDHSATAGEYYATMGMTPEEKLRTLGATEAKMVDFPKDSRLREAFPELNADFEASVPAPDMTRADGKRNIASYHPECEAKTDLGPKMYNAGPGSQNEGGNGNGGSTKLHMDASDAVNIMLWCNEPKGAAWDLFDEGDSDKVRTFLRRRFDLPHDFDPIHSQNYYIDEVLRKKLWEEEGVRSYRVYQKQGEAVFIPAAVAHQVCNLTDCIKIAIDFISPENVERCFKLKTEFQRLGWKEDILQLEMSLWYAWLSSQELRRELAGGLEAREDYQRRCAPVTVPPALSAVPKTKKRKINSQSVRSATKNAQGKGKSARFALVIPSRKPGELEIGSRRPVRSAAPRRLCDDGSEDYSEKEGDVDSEAPDRASAFKDARRSPARKRSLSAGARADAGPSKRLRASATTSQLSEARALVRKGYATFEKASVDAEAAQAKLNDAQSAFATSPSDRLFEDVRSSKVRADRSTFALTKATADLRSALDAVTLLQLAPLNP